MQVIVSVGGRFHAFYLAQQLLKRGYLKRLITSYPKFEVKKYGIPSGRVKSIIIKEMMHRGWSHLPKFLRSIYNPQFFISETFDKLAAKNLGECDICVAFSNFALHTNRRAKELGAVTIVQRGSAHMLYQQKIIEDEYEKFGLKFNRTHPKIIEKQLMEYEEADYIFVPSIFAKRTFLEKGIPEEKLIHASYGIDLSEFKQLPKGDNVFRVIFAGGMTLQKGVHYLLQAFSELNLPNSELLLIGGISDEIKPFFEKYEGTFKWLGHKPQAELHRYYSQGSVFVLNSIQDGFGMVMTQAMACGLPLISTANTGGPDLIEDGKEGFIIPIRDVEAIKERILFFYENPKLCKEMGESAKKKVSQGFTWDDFGENIVREYSRVLEDNVKHRNN